MACIAKRRGRYIVDFYDTYGKRRWSTMSKGTTKKKATEKLREIEDQLRRGIYLSDKKIPNFKQVAKDWIEHKKPNLRFSTWSVYEGHNLQPGGISTCLLRPRWNGTDLGRKIR